MFKTLFFIMIAGVQFAHAAVTVQWMSVASVALDDGKSKFLIDAAWTRPGPLHLLNLQAFRSDSKLVGAILKDAKLENVDAIFSSHSHFDHSVDVPAVAKMTGATFYADTSSARLARAYKDPSIKIQMLKAGEKVQVGSFTIIPLLREHPKLFQLIDFLPGSVPENTELSFWDYHCGDTWFYIVIHPEGTILIDQGTESHVEVVKKYTQRIDALFQGFAGRKDDDGILNGYVKTFQPKMYLPLHFDNFFTTLDRKNNTYLPGVKFEGLMGKLKKAFPKMNVVRPKFAEKVRVL